LTPKKKVCGQDDLHDLWPSAITE